MKIGQLENKAALSPTVSERKSTAAAAAAAQRGAEPSAKVELSSTALLGNDASSAVFDAGKVDRIANAIRHGKFEIDAEVIADKLITNAEELLGTRSKS